MSGFNLGSAINSAADWVCGAPIIRSIVSNPVYTAFLITALAAIVVMAIYHYQIKRAGTKRAVRALLYVFLIVTAVVFVHHYAVMRMARETSQQSGVRDLFSSIQESRGIGAAGTVPVYPMGYEGQRGTVGGSAADGGSAAGGGSAAECGCPDAARTGGHRPDNVAEDYGPLVIEDVSLPTAAGPFH
jgi:hypothetical protein